MPAIPLGRIAGLLALLAACVAVFLASTPREVDTSVLLPRSDESAERTAVPPARRALLWTAHPDDETMFFAPVVLGLVKQGWEVDALCMSIGDADGLGAAREVELYESYEVIGVPRRHVKAVNHSELQDGMTTEWSTDVLVNELEAHLARRPTDVIITFDSIGVTQHANHRALHVALLSFLSSLPADASGVRGWELVSLSLPRKFSGVVGLALRHVGGLLGDGIWRLVLAPPAAPRKADPTDAGECFGKKGRTAEVAPAWIGESLQDFIAESRAALGPRVRFAHGSEGYRAALCAMRRHRTQMVWFRWAYVAASRYMWEAELREVTGGGSEGGV